VAKFVHRDNNRCDEGVTSIAAALKENTSLKAFVLDSEAARDSLRINTVCANSLFVAFFSLQ
jgi:hypothetical protein